MQGVPARTSMRPGPGGKEELRASLLKTYVLRLKSERGERVIRQMLTNAGVDPSLLDVETGWMSVAAAKRSLRAIADSIGVDALKHRGEWTTHAEALGVLVRMLRTARVPLDAYRYLAENAKEHTRMGTWELDPESFKADVPKEAVRSIRMIYRPKEADDGEAFDTEGEPLFCAAREGELASYPWIWGLGEATIEHPSCIARGNDACVYHVSWGKASGGMPRYAVGTAAAVALGGIVLALGNWISALAAAAIGAGLGVGVGALLERVRGGDAERVFEKNRISALERGLELRGDTTTPSVEPGDLTGTVLGGKYRIGRKIGSGGIGVVYIAEHTTLGHEVAVKVLRGAAAKDGGEIARLRREAQIQAEIEQVNVARVLDLDQMPDGSMYVVMERLVGRSLADKLSREGFVTPEFGVPVFIGVCRALAATHKRGVVHRDLKPGNIFLCDDGTAKVLDFGMSKLHQAEALTQQGYTLGTPEYMAPEQCIGGAVEPRTDLYALGVLMYEAFTSELPISSPNRRDLLDLHQRQVPTSMRKRRPELNLPEELDALVMKCLKKKVQDRPADAEELERLLAAVPLLPLVAVPKNRSIPPPARLTSPDAGTDSFPVAPPPPRTPKI